ncbi:MAG: ABC transporter permease [Gemmatimonadales bacterium]
MLTLSLALRSLRNRRLTTLLTIASIALSVSLLVGVETVRRGIRESFAGTIRGTDLIVGARGGSQQLLLSSIFGLGAPAGTLSWDTYQRWAAHPAVKWTIPISLGDSYYGHRVVGTTAAFFEYYRFRNDGRVQVATGSAMSSDHDVVVGSDVASRLRIALGDSIALTHGLRGTGIMDHTEHPFVVSGILAPTYTPIDRSLFTTLEGIEAMHEGWNNGIPPMSQLAMPGAEPPPMPGADAPPATQADDGAMARDDVMPGDQGVDTLAAAADTAAVAPDIHDGHDHALTAFLLGTKNRFESLRLQREMNTDTDEALTAILPAVALTELWHTIGYAEDGARIITGAVLLVGLLGMMVALYSTLQERRREMAILRSLGAGPGRIAALLVLESGLLSLVGAVTGFALVYGLMAVGQGLAERHFGVYIPITAPGKVEWLYLVGVVAAGVLVGLVPAWRAYRNTLQDGLTIRL